jgi:hypothetical protein
MESNEGNESDGFVHSLDANPAKRIIAKAGKYTPRVSGV